MNVRKTVIPVAGFGTRFLPVTKAVPKALLPVLDTPVIHLAVEEAAAAGIEHVIMVVSPQQEAIGAYFERDGEIERMLERQGRHGLLERMPDFSNSGGDHVRRAATSRSATATPCWSPKSLSADEPLAVMLPDDVIRGGDSTIGRMIEIYRETGGPVIGVAETSEETIPQKGVVAPTSQNGRVYEISGLVEKPSIEEAPSNLAVVGRYVLPPAIFPALERTSPGAGGEIWLADGIAALLKTYRGTAYRFPGELFDTGVPAGMLKASIREALDRDDISGEIRAYISDLVSNEEAIT